MKVIILKSIVITLLFAGCYAQTTEISPISIETIKTSYFEDDVFNFTVINNTNDTLYFYTGMEGILEPARRSHPQHSSWCEFITDVKWPPKTVLRVLTLLPKEKSEQSFKITEVLEGYVSGFLKYRLRVNYGKKKDPITQISHSASFTVRKRE